MSVVLLSVCNLPGESPLPVRPAVGQRSAPVGKRGLWLGKIDVAFCPALASEHPQNEKNPPQGISFLETDEKSAVPLKLRFCATSSGSSKPYALTQHTRETPTLRLGEFGASGSEGIAAQRLPPACTNRRLSAGRGRLDFLRHSLSWLFPKPISLWFFTTLHYF